MHGYNAEAAESEIDRLQKCCETYRARIKEVEEELATSEAWRKDAALGLGESRIKRIAELERWQWDNMKKWLGIIGWGSMTPTQPECLVIIDAALQQSVEDSVLVEKLQRENGILTYQRNEYRDAVSSLEVHAVNSVEPGWVMIPGTEWRQVFDRLNRP